jgi:hypothetical protein
MGYVPRVENTALEEPQKINMAARSGSGAEASGVSPFPHLINVNQKTKY